jgi:hypothetical protein
MCCEVENNVVAPQGMSVALDLKQFICALASIQ